MHRDPAAPVDLVEKPVHDHEEDDDREEARRRLEIEGGDARGEVADDADGDEPGDERGHEAEADADGDRAAIDLVRPDHAGRESREDEDALKALAKHEDRDVERGGGCARARSRGIGIPARR